MDRSLVPAGYGSKPESARPKEMEKSCISDIKESRLRLDPTSTVVVGLDEATSELAVELRGLRDDDTGLHLLRLDLKGVKRRQKWVGLAAADEPDPVSDVVGESDGLVNDPALGVVVRFLLFMSSVLLVILKLLLPLLLIFCVVLVKIVLVERPLLLIRTAWHERCLL